MMSLSKSALKSLKKSTAVSPFQVPQTNRLFLQTLSEKGQRKEEVRDYLSLPISEKSSRAARVSAGQKKERLLAGAEQRDGLRGEQEAAQATDTAARRELRRVMRKRENITKDSKHQFMSMERQKAVLELSIVSRRSEIAGMDKAIAKEQQLLDRLEAEIERENRLFEECLKEHEKKSVAARSHFEREARSKQQKAIEIKKILAEIATTESDLEKIEETLVDYKRYRDLLFRLSPPEWQEAQRAKAQAQSDLTKSEDKPLTEESSAQSDTEPNDLRPECDPSQFEENPELFFTDPQQLQDLLTELTEQNLSLIQNSARVEETLEELCAKICSTRQHIEEDKTLLSLQINDMTQRIEAERARGNKLRQKVQLHVSLNTQDQINDMTQRIEAERARGNKLRQKVQLHVSLNTQDQDVLLDALGEKVSQVHQSCVDQRPSTFSTLEKLTHIESSLSELLQSLELIPEESLQQMRRIKESEKRARQREEKLREQQEKQKERMRRYMERSMAEPKKVLKKKPMARFVPLVQKPQESKVEEASAADDIQKYLFPSDDSD